LGNTALIERAGVTSEFLTAACVTYLPNEQLLRWAYAGHPPALWLDDGRELSAPMQGTPLGVRADPGCEEGSRRVTAGAGVLLYTDGLTEARHEGKLFGLDGVSAALAGLHRPSPTEAIAILRARVADFAYGTLTDDVCLLAARINTAGHPRIHTVPSPTTTIQWKRDHGRRCSRTGAYVSTFPSCMLPLGWRGARDATAAGAAT
jgi:serine phosphatase RsbU (regulator of sigma subunit)